MRPVLIALACALSLAFACAAEGAPNIVWIVADDMSPDMGCYGDDYAYTPNLDRFAREGRRYTSAFSVNGQCAPSRSALITGMFPTTIGTHHMRSAGLPPEYLRFVTYYLRSAGYFCTNNGKADYNLNSSDSIVAGIGRSPLGAWDEEGPRAHWRNRDDPDMPFFAVFNLSETHESRLHMSDRAFENIVKDVPKDRRHDPADAKLPAYYPDNPVFRNDWAKYYDTVSAMDVKAGHLLTQLTEDGLDHNTVVFFFGDHGRPLSRSKRWLYDSGLQVPLIVRRPEHIDAGSVSDELISFVDFTPTVLSLAGLAIPPHVQGRAFLGEAASPEPEFVFAARDRVDELLDRSRSARGRTYHYIRNDRPEVPFSFSMDYLDRMPMMQEWRRLAAAGELSGAPARWFAKTRPEEELYDVIVDPDEVNNLSNDPARANTLERMRARVVQWEEETGDLGRVPEDELIEQWRPGGQWSVTATPEAALSQQTGSSRTIEITCATPHAIVEYTYDSDLNPRWRLYTGPIPVRTGEILRMRAGRLGYFDSPVVSFSVR